MMQYTIQASARMYIAKIVGACAHAVMISVASMKNGMLWMVTYGVSHAQITAHHGATTVRNTHQALTLCAR